MPMASSPAPVRQFVTEFDPSQTLTSAPAPAVIAPIPNSARFLSRRPREPSSLCAPDAEAALVAGAPTFVPSSHLGYGLNLRNATATAAESGKAPPPQAADAPRADLMLRRYREDMASLPDHRGIDEFQEVPVEGFGAALLAGYGWSQGKGVGRNNKTGDTKVVKYARRAGTMGLGYNPAESDPKKARCGDWIVGDQRVRKEVQEKERNSHDSRKGKRRGVGNGSKLQWLQRDIRVRVVDERLSERLYMMKGRVVDVVSPTTCDIVMDDGSEIVQGVEQDMLETVLPPANGWVLVLYGEHRGVYGHLVGKNAEEEIGVVEDADTKCLIRVKYDQIAEFVGDPELIGFLNLKI